MTAPNGRMLSIARGIGARLSEGWTLESAVRECADTLGVSPDAVAAVCADVAAFLHDPYLESLSERILP